MQGIPLIRTFLRFGFMIPKERFGSQDSKDKPSVACTLHLHLLVNNSIFDSSSPSWQALLLLLIYALSITSHTTLQRSLLCLWVVGGWLWVDTVSLGSWRDADGLHSSHALCYHPLPLQFNLTWDSLGLIQAPYLWWPLVQTYRYSFESWLYLERSLWLWPSSHWSHLSKLGNAACRYSRHVTDCRKLGCSSRGK